eukprot:3263858-Lingulodinium_polyedra.AAC.1
MGRAPRRQLRNRSRANTRMKQNKHATRKRKLHTGAREAARTAWRNARHAMLARPSARAADAVAQTRPHAGAQGNGQHGNNAWLRRATDPRDVWPHAACAGCSKPGPTARPAAV